MERNLFLLAFCFAVSVYRPVGAQDFELSRGYNRGTLRLEIDNDTIWREDSNFTNGWSVQYNTVRYAAWEDTTAPGCLQWLGKHFPTLSDDGSIVRYGHGIGQNMITPGDLSDPHPQERDLPYAGTLTYSLNWQSFNPSTARIFQVTGGILGPASLAEEFQEFVHNDLGLGDDPRGWDTQRKSEPVINIAYAHFRRLFHAGKYTNGWAGQVFGATIVYLGNLITGADVVLGGRLGWNIQEGFNAFPSPPGYGIFMNSLLPKPSAAAPHSVELVLAAKVLGLAYTVFYDGSIITSDDRKVDREAFAFAAMAGFNYHYYRYFSVRLVILYETDTLADDSLPTPRPGKEKTGTDNSYGAVMVDIYF